MVRLKLKHLDLVSSEQVNYTDIAKELLQHKRWQFWKVFKFTKQLTELDKSITEIRNLDLKTVEESEDYIIKRPSSVDEITLIAMLELQGLFDADVEDIFIGELITHSIAIVCFTANVDGKFDIGSKEFLDFKKQVADSDLVGAMGLYRWISETFSNSAEDWNKAFFEVEVKNKEYEQAGGQMLDKFNVLATIRQTCADFNVNYDDALQMPYGITQANSLFNATRGYIETRMSDIAEARMKQERRG